jgi:uncharacterized protein (DUF697 family)
MVLEPGEIIERVFTCPYCHSSGSIAESLHFDYVEPCPAEINSNRHQAGLAYNIVRNKANTNAVVQGLSGIFGFPFTIDVDAAVIPTIYRPLLNDLRHLYGHTDTPDGTVRALLPQILPEIFVDMALDKVLGNIPIVGTYFNAICAKAFTWRLGTLFAMLSSRGSDIPNVSMREAMVLIRRCFPQTDMFTFNTPDEPTFIKLVTAVQSASQTEFRRKVNSRAFSTWKLSMQRMAKSNGEHSKHSVQHPA